MQKPIARTLGPPGPCIGHLSAPLFISNIDLEAFDHIAMNNEGGHGSQES